ncbi:MAG: hypothetical protein R3B47_01145 [Bacteroidia bacterium]
MAQAFGQQNASEQAHKYSGEGWAGACDWRCADGNAVFKLRIGFELPHGEALTESIAADYFRIRIWRACAGSMAIQGWFLACRMRDSRFISPF